jgi:hypothetical protein
VPAWASAAGAAGSGGRPQDAIAAASDTTAQRAQFVTARDDRTVEPRFVARRELALARAGRQLLEEGRPAMHEKGKIACLLANEFEDSEFQVPCDWLSAAGLSRRDHRRQGRRDADRREGAARR